MTIYNKLVRDNIPAIFESEGKKCVSRILNDDDYKIALLKKIVEEAAELRDSRGGHEEMVKEVGDVQEVLECIIAAFGLDAAEIARVNEERKKARGSFVKKVFLESAE